MNKRAITEYGILTLIFGIIVVIAIAVTAPVVFRVLFGPSGEEQTGLVALDSLYTTVLELYNNKDPIATRTRFPLFIQANKFIIVAFNKDDAKVQNACHNKDDASRPAACPDSVSCLCIYKDVYSIVPPDTDDFDSADSPNPPFACKQFPGDVIFLAPVKTVIPGFDNSLSAVDEGGDSDEGWNFGKLGGSASVSATNAAGHPLDSLLVARGSRRYAYENLLLYGQCDQVYWNKQEVYIEKVASAGKTYFYIARETTNTWFRSSVAKQAALANPAEIRKLVKQGGRVALEDALRSAYDNVAFLPANADAQTAAQAQMLLGEAWESIAKSLFPSEIEGVVKGLGPERQSLINRFMLIAKDSGEENAAKLLAADYYWFVVSTYYRQQTREELAKVPQIIEAAFKAFALVSEANDPGLMQQYGKVIDDLKSKNVPEIENVDLILLRSGQEQLKNKRPVSSEAVDWTAWDVLLQDVEQYRKQLSAFVDRAAQSEHRKEALYLLAWSYSYFPELSALAELQSNGIDPLDSDAREKAIEIHGRILREFGQEAKLGRHDAKGSVWFYCFTGHTASSVVNDACQRLIQEGLINRPPLASDYALDDPDQRKNYYVAIEKFASESEQNNDLETAIRSYRRLVDVFIPDQEPVFTSKDDYEILARAHLAMARLRIKQGYSYDSQGLAMQARDYAREAGNDDLQDQANEVYKQGEPVRE